MFERVLINLIENAIEYSPVDGKVLIKLSIKDYSLIFEISDQGPGVSDTDKERIFERFVRLDQTRHQFEGSGLGLAIVKWAVEAHGGLVKLTDNETSGSVFKVSIPIRQA